MKLIVLVKIQDHKQSNFLVRKPNRKTQDLQLNNNFKDHKHSNKTQDLKPNKLKDLIKLKINPYQIQLYIKHC